MTLPLARHARRRSWRRTPHTRWFVVLLAGLALALGVALVAVLASTPPSRDDLAWPAAGAAAMHWDETVAASPDADRSYPIGSIAKLVTALVVLDRLPLDASSPGPTLEMTEDDAAFARTDPGPAEHRVAVTAGEPLSLRALLEDTLVASSNTHARALAGRVFGDETSYVTAARAWLDARGLTEITVADASGISPENSATVRALVELGRIADRTPVIRSIVAMPGVRSPDGGWIAAVNPLLGVQGIDGLKTGHPGDGGYAMVFSATRGGSRVIGAIVGAPSISQRSTDVVRLLAQVNRAP